MSSPWWDTRTWRLIQTNLREIDMLDIRAGQVVADLQAFKANVLMINAAGIIASYPTRLPFHFQSPYLKGDSLEDILAACHQAGIQVFARTDFSKIRRPIYEAHPEWATVTASSKVIDYNGDVQACINGDYQQKYMLLILEELLTTHDFDGIFFNMGGFQVSDYSGNYHGICHCHNCQRLFLEMYGLPLPEHEDRADPCYRKYILFKQRTISVHRARVVSFLHNLRPELCIAEPGELGQGFQRMESNTALDRPLPHWQYSASDNTKGSVTGFPAVVTSNTTVDFIDFPYRHVAVSPHQQALRLAQSLANGGALDYYLIGRLDNHQDRSGFEQIQKIFHYHAAHEADYHNLRSKASIGLFKANDSGEYRGWFRILVENHFLFDVLGVNQALGVSWERYRTLIMPDIQAVGDDLAARIDDFVAAGGTLIGTGQSGFHDGEDESRTAPALHSLGIRRLAQVRTDMRSSYFKLEDKTLFPRFAHTDLVYLDGPYLYSEYEDDIQPYLKLIPPHPFGPPERCYYTQVTDHPAFTQHPFGLGKAIYIPWLPGTLFHRQGHTNTSDFLADLLQNSAGTRPVGGNILPMVEVTHQTKEDGSCDLVHLVNASGHFGVSFYEPIPILNVALSLPYNRPPAEVRCLVSGERCEYEWVNHELVLHIPRLDLFEAVQIRNRVKG
jgi:hypothetical protein